jgi:hypothetical protein
MPPRVKEAKGEGDEGLLLVGEGQRGQGPSGGTQGAELLAASIEGHFYCTSKAYILYIYIIYIILTPPRYRLD